MEGSEGRRSGIVDRDEARDKRQEARDCSQAKVQGRPRIQEGLESARRASQTESPKASWDLRRKPETARETESLSRA